MAWSDLQDYFLNTEKGRFFLHSTLLIAGAAVAGVVVRVIRVQRRQGLPMKDERTVRNLMRDGEYLEAGEWLLGEGQLERALECFSKIRYYRRMADVYLKMGLVQKAAMMYERDGDYYSAADVYLADGKPSAVYELSERVPKKAEFAAYLAEIGQKAIAADVYVQARCYREAADLYANLGDYGRAVEILVKSLKANGLKEPRDEVAILKDIARYCQAAGMKNEAESFLKKAADLEKTCGLRKVTSGEVVRRDDVLSRPSAKAPPEGLPEGGAALRSSAISRKTSLSRLRSNITEGDIERMLNQGQWEAAAEAYSRLERYREAALLYETHSEFELAAELFARAEDYDRAGRNYEKVGNVRLALQCYEVVGNHERVAALARQLKEWKRLGAALMSLERWEEAVGAFEKIPRDNPEYGSVVKQLAKAHYSLGHYSVAKALYRDYEQRWAESKREKLDSLYYQALSAEKEERFGEAIESFQELLNSNYKKDEISKRLRELDGVAQEKRTHSKLSEVAFKEGPVRYVREKEVGRGGMAVVYKAKDSVLGRIVALKVLLDSFKKNPQAVEIFLREAKATAIMNHPNIVTVYDAGHEADDFYIAMEFIEGVTLKSILKKRKLTPEEIVKYLRQLATGLHYAHEHNIVHRDMTTNNIMIDKNDTLKIMDFGLVKILEKVQAEQSLIGGTPSYMPPEQILGKPVDRRSDIYSYGICLFEMLVGKVPFSGGDASYHHLHSPLPDIKSINPDAPAYLCEIAERCLKKKKEERFQSLSEVLERLNKEAPA